jgi:hypothetical protein
VGEAVSAIVPSALAAAISPIPITAVILMLFTARARVNAPIFTLGWALGLLVVTAIAYLIGDSQDLATDEVASNWAFAMKAILGILLLLLALRQWRGRLKASDPAPPTWMEGLDQFTSVKAFGLGALFGGPSPKNLLLSVAAGTTVAQLGATGADACVAIFVYVLLGTVTVGGPVLYYFAAGKRAEENLNELVGWLGANNATVMAMLLLIFGVFMLSDGLQSLFA